MFTQCTLSMILGPSREAKPSLPTPLLNSGNLGAWQRMNTISPPRTKPPKDKDPESPPKLGNPPAGKENPLSSVHLKSSHLFAKQNDLTMLPF